MLGRLRKVAAKADRRGLRNLELLRANNLELVGYQLPDRSVQRIHLLCPDPWPKARHRHHRFITTDFLTRLARVLSPRGVLHLATDHLPYLDDIQRIVADMPLFHPAPEACDDVRDIKTDFELLWEAEGRSVPHLVFRRAD
jgi:tRNA (guanine-N7-)-methyltransferase